MRAHRHTVTPRTRGKSSLGISYGLRPTPADHPACSVANPSPPYAWDATSPVVDYREIARPVRNQGSESSCSGFAWSLWRAVVHARAGRPVLGFDLSPAFLWWQERSREVTTDRDVGAYLGDGATILQTIGCCPDQDMPYQIGDYSTAPSPHAESTAADWRVSLAFSIQRDLSVIKQALGAGPLVLGIQVYQSFESTGSGGIVALPDTSREGYLGGHAVCCLGYDDVRRVLIVRNQWGSGWGDAGDCYLPYAFLPYVDEIWSGVE